MTKRKLDTERLYKLIKKIVLTITGIALIVMLWTGYQTGFGTDIMLNRWVKYCAEHPDNPETVKLTGLTCMSIGLDQINDWNEIFWKAFLVVILLPVTFFGGTRLFNYLYPKQNKEAS